MDMKKIVVVFLFCVMLCNMPAAFAVKMLSLYQAQLPVAAQSDDLKATAIKDGFLQVLIKLSGNPEISKNPIIAANLSRADYYVQEISYSSTTTTSSEYIIRIRYDADAVNYLLKKAGVSCWGNSRPLILVWLAVSDHDKATEIISNETQNDIFALAKDQGKKFGLPLIFPVMDVDDVSQVSTDDVTDMVMPVLKEAAKRYAPDALLIGKMQVGQGGNIESEWRLASSGEEWNWTITDKTPEAVLYTVVNQVSQTLSKLEVLKPRHENEVWVKLEVMNVVEREDYGQLMEYLRQLPPVQKIRLVGVSGDVVEVSVLVRGSAMAFQEAAAKGQRLAFKYEDRPNNRFGYVWSQSVLPNASH